MTPNPLKWHGGKEHLVDWLMSLMPDPASWITYIEPYFGGGALLRALPLGKAEVVGDTNLSLTNFWEVLRRPDLFEKFRRQVEATPFSEWVWEGSEFGTCVPDGLFVAAEELPSVDAAVAFFIRNRQSRQGLMKSFATLSKTRTRRQMNEQASSWLTAVEDLPLIHARLIRVVIRTIKAPALIAAEDAPGAFFYCDPPYMHSTRAHTTSYGEHEMSDEEHCDLLDTLAGIKGRFMLSGYRNEMYDAYAAAFGWNRFDKEVPNSASASEVKQIKIESVWRNY